MASVDEWRREYNFLEPEDIGIAFLADTGEDDSEWGRSRRRDELYFDFDRERPINVRELSPELSISILDNYGFDPYSNDYSLKSEALLAADGDEFLRVGYSDDAVYLGIGDAELPTQPDYLEAEKPRWRS